MFASLFLVILGLCYCNSQNISLDRPHLEGPSEALVKKVVEFRCHVPNHPKNESILLQIYKEGNRSKLLGATTSLQGEVAVIPMVVRHSHGGYVECVATAQNNSDIIPSVSNPHYLKVVEPVKNAKINSSSPVEIHEGGKLSLHCQVGAGTDVSYKWLRDGWLISESDQLADNQLKISRVTPKDSGSYMCMATNVFNKTQVFTSNSSEVVVTVKEFMLTLNNYSVLEGGSSTHYVPVHGPVMMYYDYDTEENEAPVLRFYCQAANGSHLRYQWFFNDMLLQNEGSFYHVIDYSPEFSMLELVKKKPGKYHCEVSDMFDITNVISSKKYYVKEEVLRLPIFVPAVVFGCLAFEILLVSACCWIGAVWRRRQYGPKSLWSLEMKRNTAAYEGELDLSVYDEDPDMVTSAREDEFDQTSEASVDEWPQIEKEKKTLEDEPV